MTAPPDPTSREHARPIECCAIEFDFDKKVDRELPREDVAAAIAAGRQVWVDVDLCEDRSGQWLKELDLLDESVIEDALFNEPLTRIARFEDYIHLVVSGCRPSGPSIVLERVDVVIGENFLLTIHRGPALFLSTVRRDYRADFQRHAQSMSFLVYELWDHLLDNYLETQKAMEEQVETLQALLRSDEVEDKVFTLISELGAVLLHFRKVLLPARAVLKDLSTRKTIFLSEATQPFLANMVGTVESVLQDLLVDREMLSESLNLHMSIVGHRTNLVMSRLTVVSVIFLPLTFLVGVYGMNFDLIPELKWTYGYAYFWITTALIVIGLLVVLKRNKLL